MSAFNQEEQRAASEAVGSIVSVGQATFHRGDVLAVLRILPDNSFDSIVTDPPYELGFMGKGWDKSGIANNPEMWAEAMRVLKPGGHLLAFSGSRTYHRMACAIEDSGFEIRDQIMWVYGSGFPKSLDVSKAFDKARDDRDDILRVTIFIADAAERAGLSRADVDAAMGTSDMGGWWLSRLRHRCQCPKWEQWLQLKILLSLGDDLDAEVWRLNGRKGTPGEAWQSAKVLAVDVRMNEPSGIVGVGQGERVEVAREIKAANSDAARQWDGWGTALKPAHEPICVARKPLAKGCTVAANVLAHGTGALNIDGCRVPFEATANAATNPLYRAQQGCVGTGSDDGSSSFKLKPEGAGVNANAGGRWPANFIHDGSAEVVALFPAQAGASAPVRGTEASAASVGRVTGERDRVAGAFHGDSGSAARFFYCAKASRADRNEGLDVPGHQFAHGSTLRDAENLGADRKGNHHPTVKPTDLMAYLCRLITPPGGKVLDLFFGSGSTGKACMREGFEFYGIDKDEDENGAPVGYLEIAVGRTAFEIARVAAAMAAANVPPAPTPQLDLFAAPAVRATAEGVSHA